MIFKDKAELYKNIEKNIENYPQIKKYFATVVFKTLKQNNTLESLLEIPLFRNLGTDTCSGFEEYLSEKKSIKGIEKPLGRLKKNLEEYPSVLAELEAGKLLQNEGYDEVTFSPKNSSYDIEYSDNGIKRYAEVKSLRDISPETSYLFDKFEAKSLSTESFVREFSIKCEYEISNYKDVNMFHDYMKDSIDSLIQNISGLLRNGTELINCRFYDKKHPEISYLISSKKSKEFTLILNGIKYWHGNPSDVFIPFGSILYPRLITAMDKGYKQLLHQRGKNTENTRKDRLYVFLNLWKGSFVDEKVEKIFVNLTKTIGLSELVDIKFII